MQSFTRSLIQRTSAACSHSGLKSSHTLCALALQTNNVQVRQFSRKPPNISPEEAAAILRTQRRDLAGKQRDEEHKREALSAQVLFNLGSSGLLGEEEDVLVKQRPEFQTFTPIDATKEKVDDLELQKDALLELESLEQSRKTIEFRPIYYRNVDKFGRARGKGKRKASKANVILSPGTGKFTVNGKSHMDYFPRPDHRLAIFAPFHATDTELQFDVEAYTHGGGHTGQSGAIRLAIARAMALYNPNYRKFLQSRKLLSVDARRVERKKPGMVGARRAPQWVKR